MTVRPSLVGDSYEERQQNYVERRDNGTLDLERTVAVPRYGDPDRATLWLQALPGGRYAVVVSEVDPPHEDWPGEIRGWPQPSEAYRRKLINERIRHNENLIEVFRKGVKNRDGSRKEISDYKSHIKRLTQENMELKRQLP
ncbi:hypothetical protein KBTX_04436 [wastewater metagenome]|uniref:Uncharacterized protein n=3 Tax=root TaxID=1 RepID=A0A5B8RJ69_9ZZZZ|nr:hypothetical protein KBTEX_04436 [uncultured organism]